MCDLSRAFAMGIRGIEPLLHDRNVSQASPLSALAHCRLGIDAELYLHTLLSDPNTREPLVASTGGVPLALIPRIENDLRTLDRLGIKPIFVFPGLPLAHRPPPKGFDRENQVKNDAWAYYEAGQVERAIVTLTQIRGGAWTDLNDIVRSVTRLFRHRLVEHIIAPYKPQAQLAYLQAKKYIHAVYSSSEALLWPIDRVITSLDLPTSFTYVERSRLLVELNLNHEQFLDMSILAGCSLSRTVPPFASDFALMRVIDLVRHYKSGLSVCQAWRQDPQMKNYGDLFMRARLAVKYSLVLTTEGTCQPLPLVVPPVPPITPNDVPADLDEIFSLRLPDEVYFHLCRGLISPAVVGWLSSGVIVEGQPLADSPDYRRFIKDVITEGHTAPRCTTLALLADGLHPQWRQRRVTAHYYYGVSGDVPFADVMTRSLVDKCSSWAVPTVVIENELRRQSSSTIDMRLCIGTLVTEELATQTRRKSSLDKKDEIVANAIWRFLDVRGFIQPNHTQTMMGKALHAACVSSRVNDRFQEAIYLVLELLRAGVVHGSRWSEVYSGGPSFGSEEEQRSTLLIMRVMSVLPLTFRPQQWAGPLSRELLVFNSFVRALSKSLRGLFEATSVHMLLSGDARRNRDDFSDIMLSLPFQGDVNTGFGILAKTYLDAATFHFGDTITLENMREAESAKRDALDFVENSFSSVKAPVQEVERGFRFWDAVMVAIRTLDKEQGPTPALANSITSPAIIEQFERADTWLRPIRP